MSKGNMLLGFARGKVGSLVFSRANGKQITRAKADVIRNPQTQAQYIQRIILNTVSQAYSNMCAIVDHSFEGVAKGQKSMSFFMKKNMDALREKIARAQADGLTLAEVYNFAPLGTDYFMLNDYLIAKGSLPTIDLDMPAAGQEDQYSIVSGLAANTYGAVLNAFGLERGDQLTFVQMISGKFYYTRVILDPRNEDGSAAPLNSVFVLDNAIGLPSERNEGNFYSLTYDAGAIKFAIKSGPVYAGAIIVSRKNEDDTWMRSTTSLKSQIDETSGEWFLSMHDAIDESQFGITLGSSRYLNNAGVGGGGAANESVPEVTSVTFDGTAYSVPKAYQVSSEDSSVIMNAISARGLDRTKTYVVKAKRSGGAQVGSDIAVSSNGTITATTINISAGETLNVALYENGTQIQQFATITKLGENGDFGG